MDQEQASEASTSFPTQQLNARAPEFVPRSAAAATLRPPVFQHTYCRPPPFLPPLPMPFYGYEYLSQNTMPFYGYNVNPVRSMDLWEGYNGLAASSSRNELSDAHQKILSQVEFYFSDINLATTNQLFTIMSNDPEGYVPISVIASFRKIKSAVNDSTQLANILQMSKKLVVSKDGTKVKRLNPFSESDLQELQSRVVVAENLPEDHSHQNLMKLFSSVGRVKSIRTCPPQKSIDRTSSASKTERGDRLHFSSKFHAFVEYESVEEAEKAVCELKDESNWRNGLNVRLLIQSAVHTTFFDDLAKPTEARAKKVGRDGETNGMKDDANGPEMLHFKENHSGDVPQFDSHFHQHSWENNGSNNAQRKGMNGFGGRANGKGKGKGQGRGWVQSSINNGSILGHASSENSGSSEKLTGLKTSSVPRMPDGTKGFCMGRGKPVVVNIA